MDPEEHRAQGMRAGYLERLPPRVEVYEVGPRDGLQNEAKLLPTEDKLRLVEALVAAGLRRIEVSSFVSARWVPQLSDAERLFERLGRREGVVFSALVPNLKGLERARAAGVEEAAVFLSASETHSQKNINKSIDEAIDTSRQVAGAARALGMRVRGYISTVWGCPYEGEVPIARVVEICRRLEDADLYQVSLSDTIGVGTPRQTGRILEALFRILQPARIALHLHDTRGTALANALVGLSMGVSTLDASVGGLGGCPYAPGAAGNLATEDLVYMLHGMGIETGVDLERLVDAGLLAQSIIGRRLPGKYLAAAQARRGSQAGSRPSTVDR